MANVILTLIDSKNGVVTTSYTFPDEDLAKIYTAYTHYLTPPSEDDKEPSQTPSPKEVVDRIYEELLNSITSFTYNEQVKIACETLNITPIKASGS